MTCYLCGSGNAERVEGKVRDRPDIGILRCAECGLVFLDSFAHVDATFYRADYTNANHPEQSWQHHLNACRTDDERRLAQISPHIANRRYLDVGCGGGGVLLRARAHCSVACGVEPQSRWRAELADEGIEMHASLDEVDDGRFDVATAFHVLEHVADPLTFLRKLAAKVAAGGLLWLEVPSADDALLNLYRSKAFSEFTYWSPHLFLYSPHTFGLLLRKAGLESNAVIQQFQRYPLSNHLHWLAHGKPGGHETWSFLDSPALTQTYASQLAALGKCDTLIATIRKAAL